MSDEKVQSDLITTVGLQMVLDSIKPFIPGFCSRCKAGGNDSGSEDFLKVPKKNEPSLTWRSGLKERGPLEQGDESCLLCKGPISLPS